MLSNSEREFPSANSDNLRPICVSRKLRGLKITGSFSNSTKYPLDAGCISRYEQVVRYDSRRYRGARSLRHSEKKRPRETVVLQKLSPRKAKTCHSLRGRTPTKNYRTTRSPVIRSRRGNAILRLDAWPAKARNFVDLWNRAGCESPSSESRPRYILTLLVEKKQRAASRYD